MIAKDFSGLQFDRQVVVNLPYHVLSLIVVGDNHHFIKITLHIEWNMNFEMEIGVLTIVSVQVRHNIVLILRKNQWKRPYLCCLIFISVLSNFISRGLKLENLVITPRRLPLLLIIFASPLWTVTERSMRIAIKMILRNILDFWNLNFEWFWPDVVTVIVFALAITILNYNLR